MAKHRAANGRICAGERVCGRKWVRCSEPGREACTVGVSWNNFQQPRWAAHDQPNIKKTVEAGGGTYIDADANLGNEQQATDIDTMISKGAKVLIVLAQDTRRSCRRSRRPRTRASRSSPMTA